MDQDYDLVSPTQLPEHEEGRGKMSSKKRKRLDSYVVRTIFSVRRLCTPLLPVSIPESSS